jgi:hypothetical protein
MPQQCRDVIPVSSADAARPRVAGSAPHQRIAALQQCAVCVGVQHTTASTVEPDTSDRAQVCLLTWR